jgi:hypothetical protein
MRRVTEVEASSFSLANLPGATDSRRRPTTAQSRPSSGHRSGHGVRLAQGRYECVASSRSSADDRQVKESGRETIECLEGQALCHSVEKSCQEWPGAESRRMENIQSLSADARCPPPREEPPGFREETLLPISENEERLPPNPVNPMRRRGRLLERWPGAGVESRQVRRARVTAMPAERFSWRSAVSHTLGGDSAPWPHGPN